MANISWPELLPPTLLLAGLSMHPQDNVIRTSMDAGPKKARRRYTASIKLFSGKQVFDAAELAVFEQFYHTVLADGVLRFNFKDPITLEVAEFRFAGPYSNVSNEGRWEVTVQMERMS
jgi:hypothetical protein